MKSILTIFIFFPICIYSQKATFKEIRLRPLPKFYKTDDSTINYPLVIISNQVVSKLINDQIRDALFIEPDKKNSTKTELKKWIADGLTDMSYEISLNKNGLLSMTVNSQACGAYCSSSTVYLNFDLITGKRLKAEDLIIDGNLVQFKKIVFSDKQSALKKYKAEELKSLLDKEIDSVDYQWAIEEVDSNCINQIDVEQFKLSVEEIQIMDECEFPHAIQAIEPDYELKYPLKQIKKFIRPELLNRLLE